MGNYFVVSPCVSAHYLYRSEKERSGANFGRIADIFVTLKEKKIFIDIDCVPWVYTRRNH